MNEKSVVFAADSEFDAVLPELEGQELRLEVVGAPGVGKSALILRYTTGDFRAYDPTIEESCREPVFLSIDGIRRSRTCMYIDILDTPPDDEQHAWNDHEKSRHGFLICFAIDDRASFNHLTSRILRLETIKEQKAQEIPMVICAMKSDLDADRVIAPDEAQSLADSIGALYVETSAKDGKGVDEAFGQLIKTSVRFFKEQTKRESTASASSTSICLVM